MSGNMRQVVQPFDRPDRPAAPPQAPRTLLLSQLVGELLQKGYHPRDIRRQLQARGVRWAYSYDRKKQNNRECARRQRQLNLCAAGCGQWAPPQREPRICDDCLAAKWSD